MPTCISDSNLQVVVRGLPAAHHLAPSILGLYRRTTEEVGRKALAFVPPSKQAGRRCVYRQVGGEHALWFKILEEGDDDDDDDDEVEGETAAVEREAGSAAAMSLCGATRDDAGGDDDDDDDDDDDEEEDEEGGAEEGCADQPASGPTLDFLSLTLTIALPRRGEPAPMT